MIYVFNWLGGCKCEANNQSLNVYLCIILIYFLLNAKGLYSRHIPIEDNIVGHPIIIYHRSNHHLRHF
jgi:hypothetical protein